jgi:Signal recognition particle 19 kDa protein
MKRIIWEAYFDPSISRKYGRRVAKGLNHQRIEEVLKSMGLKFSVSTAKYPRLPWKEYKRYEVEWEKPKWILIKEIERRLKTS